MFKDKVGKRVSVTNPGGVRRNSDGTVRGRDAKGNPISGRIAGKSKARQLMEAAEAKKKKPEPPKKKRRK
jgi:hypothetical protein